MREIELKTKRGTNVRFEIIKSLEQAEFVNIEEINILDDSKWWNPNGDNYDLDNEYTFVECEDEEGFYSWFAIIK